MISSDLISVHDAANIVLNVETERSIAFRPAYFRMTGSVTAALFLQQCIHNTRRYRRSCPDGWFTHTRDEWQSETCLTHEQQETARRILRKIGLLHEKRSGIPAKSWFFVDMAVYIKLLRDDAISNEQQTVLAGLLGPFMTGCNIDASADDFQRDCSGENEDPYIPTGDGSVEDGTDYRLFDELREYAANAPIPDLKAGLLGEEYPSTPNSIDLNPETNMNIGFSEFYSAYPNKKARPYAERAYFKARRPKDKKTWGITHASIMAGLARAKASTDWAECNGKYIPHPSTWLNAAGWDDDYRPKDANPLPPQNGNGALPQPPPVKDRWAQPSYNYTGSPAMYIDSPFHDTEAHRARYGWHRHPVTGEWDVDRWIEEHS